ncbi:MAG TPA: redoxin domain-containing protein [Bacteroidota bacterium]
MLDYRSRQFRAPAVYGNFWFNTEPFSISDLQGRVVLVEFWDHTSVPSLRSLHYVKEWALKYQEFGLVVVGVHTPVFQFGRVRENIEAAIKELGIDYPVVADNDSLARTAFGCRTLPGIYVIDKDGFIRFSREGEGGYDQTERMIQSLLAETGNHGEFPDLSVPFYSTDLPGVVNYRVTGDIHAGYLRGLLGNPEGYSPEGTLDFADQGIYLLNRFYLKGKWMSEKEFVRFVGESTEEGVASVRYEAAEVNAVLGPGNNKPSSLLVQQDGAWLSADHRGRSIRVGSDGSTAIQIERPGVFNLVKNKDVGEFVLTLKTGDPMLQVFLFSFVTAPIEEPVHSN